MEYRVKMPIAVLAMIALPVMGKYLGCFPANIGLSLRTEKTWQGRNMTVSTCSIICSANKYVMYGLQYGSRCYCSNQTELAESTEESKGPCNTPCKGSVMCGGNQAMAVHTHSRYIGCFTYSPDDVVNFGGKLSNLTPNICREKCSAFSYFGLTQGNKCFCQSFLSTTPRLDDADCKENGLPCHGGEKCGGSGHIALWNYKEDNNIESTWITTDATVIVTGENQMDCARNLSNFTFISTAAIVAFILGCLALAVVKLMSDRCHRERDLSRAHECVTYTTRISLTSLSGVGNEAVSESAYEDTYFKIYC